MRYRLVFFILFISFFILTALLFAQPSRMRMKPGMGMRPWRGDEQCWKASDLNLSSDQAKALELIQQTHFRETKLLRAELFLKRLELREFFANPAAKTETIRSKYTEVNDLQTKLEEKVIDYLIKVRGVLTSEQLKNWCPEQEIPFFRQMMQRNESMGSKLRRPFPQEGRKEE